MEEVFDPINYVLPVAFLIALAMVFMNRPKCLKM